MTQPSQPQWGSSYQPPSRTGPRMHIGKKIAIGVGGTFVGLTAIGLIGNAVDPVDSKPTAAHANVRPAAATTPARNLPNLVGKTLPAARTAARTAGFTNLLSHDATDADRMQILDGHWTVCFQKPDPGPTAVDTAVDLAVVKVSETCPVADGSPAPTPTPTPTPSPSPTTTKPTPKPTATHYSTTGGSSTSGGGTTGGSSGGSSTTGGSTTGGTSDHNGATALCNDGTLSYAAHHQGACSHHGGVAVFYR